MVIYNLMEGNSCRVAVPPNGGDLPGGPQVVKVKDAELENQRCEKGSEKPPGDRGIDT